MSHYYTAKHVISCTYYFLTRIKIKNSLQFAIQFFNLLSNVFNIIKINKLRSILNYLGQQ